jgi:hypothetical protein
LKAIIDHLASYIETWAQDYASTLVIKNWGFCELTKKTARGKRGGQLSLAEQSIPVTINGTGEREQVSLDDQYNFIYWIRIPGRIQVLQNDDDQWGLKDGKRQNMPLRIVVCHKVDLGEDLITELVQDLPANFYVTGFEFVFLNASSDVDFDHEGIHETELGKTNYEKHRFDWNIYVINLNVEYIPCTDFVPREYITDAFGNCLFA